MDIDALHVVFCVKATQTSYHHQISDIVASIYEKWLMSAKNI